MDLLACPLCGAAVVDGGTHERWHGADEVGAALARWVDTLTPEVVEAGVLQHLGGLNGGEMTTGGAVIAWLREQVAE